MDPNIECIAQELRDIASCLHKQLSTEERRDLAGRLLDCAETLDRYSYIELD